MDSKNILFVLISFSLLFLLPMASTAAYFSKILILTRPRVGSFSFGGTFLLPRSKQVVVFERFPHPTLQLSLFKVFWTKDQHDQQPSAQQQGISWKKQCEKVGSFWPKNKENISYQAQWQSNRLLVIDDDLEWMDTMIEKLIHLYDCLFGKYLSKYR